MRQFKSSIAFVTTVILFTFSLNCQAKVYECRGMKDDKKIQFTYDDVKQAGSLDGLPFNFELKDGVPTSALISLPTGSHFYMTIQLTQSGMTLNQMSADSNQVMNSYELVCDA